jgi:hypothetical protein
MDINETTAKRVIKRQYNIIVDEEFELKKTLSMETDNSMPEYSFSGLYTRVEEHLKIINDAQNKIVLLQNIVNPE